MVRLRKKLKSNAGKLGLYLSTTSKTKVLFLSGII